MYNVDPKLGTVGVRPPVDAIHEFGVQTSTYDASFGRNGGGQVNVVTQSWLQSLSGHGLRILQERRASRTATHFAPRDEPEPDYNRNQFGGSIGGPIAANRLFFFADYEGTRLSEGITRVTNVPTLAERQGDFSQSLFPAPVNPFSGEPFPGGAIPSFALSPIGSALAALYPLPNRNTPFANYVSSPTATDDVRPVRRAARSRACRRGSRWTRGTASAIAACSSRSRAPASRPYPGFGNFVERRGQNLIGRLQPAAGLDARQRSAVRLQPRRHRGPSAEPADRQRVGRNEVAGDQPA